jgi:ATP-dependent Clp protease ATP-binding subunit ClpC
VTPRIERLSGDARSALGRARRQALKLRHEHIAVEHIFLGLLARGSAAHVLQSLGADLALLRDRVEEQVGLGSTLVTLGMLPLTPEARTALARADALAAGLGERRITPLHLLLAVLEPETGGAAAEVLASVPIPLVAAREEAVRLAGDPRLLARARAFKAHLPWKARPLSPVFSYAGLTLLATFVIYLVLAFLALRSARR